MFYIICSRIPVIASNPDSKYFRVFFVGSILYTILHYYLHSNIRTGFLEKFRQFLYHIMGVDYMISVVLLKYVSISKPEELDDDNTLNELTSNKETQNKNENTNEDNKHEERLLELQRMRELQEQRRIFLEQHQQKLLQQRLEEENKKSKQSKTTKSSKSSKSSKDIETQSTKSTKSTKSKSNKSTDSDNSSRNKKAKSKKSENKENKEKEPENVTESELPIYE